MKPAQEHPGIELIVHEGGSRDLQRQLSEGALDFALVVDARFNAGGHVSGLVLEKLARRRLGWDVPRRGAPISYPDEAPAGPLVLLTNRKHLALQDLLAETVVVQEELDPISAARLAMATYWIEVGQAAGLELIVIERPSYESSRTSSS